jgi:hypothetical protein
MRLIFFLIGISLALASGGKKEKNFSSKWRNQASEDLNIKDSEYQSYKKGLVLYYISNDNENLYLDMKVKETIEQSKILKIGMSVWINMDSKSHKKAGIRFPIGSDYSGGRKSNSMTKVSTPTPLSLANTIQLVGFNDVQPSRFPADNKDNFRGKAWYNTEGDLRYFLVIPLSKISSLDETSDKSGLITLGIEFGVPPEMGFGGPPPSGSMGAGGARPGGGGGGRPAGGGPPPAGMGGGSSSSATDLGSPVLLWVKNINLARNN